MKRGGNLKADPVRAAERRQKREQRRQADGPRVEDVRREERRATRDTARNASPSATLKRSTIATATKRRPISEASPQQRAAVANKACVVCRESPTDPAHLLPRGMCPDGDGDARAVVPLCRIHHRLFDEGSFDLLPYLEPHFRTELAFAVERAGFLTTWRRVTNERDPRRAA